MVWWLDEVLIRDDRYIDRYRREQSWPVKIVKGDIWDEVYDAALKTVDDDSMLLKSAGDAVEWTNNLISKILEA